MNKIETFLNNYYNKAVKLSDDFSITREYEWTPLLILNELSIQVGQIYNIIYKKNTVNEPNRDSDKITVEGNKVGYMYREEPSNEIDSG